MIEFQYFDGCPNADKTLQNLKELIDEGTIKDELMIKEVPNIDAAKELNFQGSPTMLLDGVDIYTEKEPKGANYSCRVYVISYQQTGILPKEYIKKQILKLKAKNAK